MSDQTTDQATAVRVDQMRAEARALDERANNLQARADLLRIKADKLEAANAR